MVRQLLIIAVANLSETHAVTLAEHAALVAPHAWWSQPIGDHCSVSQKLLLNGQLTWILQLVGFGNAGDRLALSEVATADAFSPRLVLSAFLSDNSTVFHQKSVHNAPAAIAALGKIVTR